MKLLLILIPLIIVNYSHTVESVLENAVGIAQDDLNYIYHVNDDDPDVLNEKPTIEVVFVLDATGSMTNLIEGAKRKIWDIANKIMTGDPVPEVKIGLVVYRDRGDEFVVKQYDLTDDIDAIYNKLIAVQAQGGGDFQEDVNMALAYAVDSINWSDDGNTLKMIFLVGDADPHMDYNDERHYPDICKQAISQDIIINALRCGNNTNTEQVWQEIAHLAEGYYTTIDYSASADIPTPYDDEISSLSSELYGTVLVYGSDLERTETTAMLEVNEEAAGYSKTTTADRAVNAAMRAHGGTITTNDLLGGIIGGEIDLDDIEEDELPDELKDLTPEQRQVYVDSLIEEREQISNRITELSKLRVQYIEENTEDTDESFDAFVIEILKNEADRINVRYED